MTSTDTQSASRSTDTPPPGGTLRKSTLFCPNCGHESAMEDDWIVRWDDTAETFVCPDCDTVVASR